MLTNPTDARQRLQVHLSLRKYHDRTTSKLTTDCSAVLRSNTTMLFTVFGAAFGMQLYVTVEQHARKGRMLK